MQDTIGVDISKDRLDAYALAAGEARVFANDKTGQRALRRWAGKLGGPLVVFEPTGPYHRAFERGFATEELAFVKVNPRQARRFAEAMGRLAKTDRADAASLARMGAALDLRPDPPTPEILQDLGDLLTARQALVRDRVATRTRARIARLALIRRQLAARLSRIRADLKALDAEIDRIVDADPDLARRREILETIPGVGRAAAVALIIAMPELGTLDGKAAASLAGLAPITRQSGKWKGQAHIGGGRAYLRRLLYMPALSAVRHNPDHAQKHDQLRDRGKPPKVAVTAFVGRTVPRTVR